MLTDDEKDICKRYSKRDDKNRVHCAECPLVIDAISCVCKAFAHTTDNGIGWEFDFDGGAE